MSVKEEIKDIEASVRSCYSTWSTNYYTDYFGDGASYPPVHRDLIQKLLRSENVSTLLDAGCGPASMLRDLQPIGTGRYGFDLTPQMVTEGQNILGEQGVPADNLWVGSVLSQNSFVAPDGRKEFDAAICIGVLPHIPEDQESTVFSNLCNAVKPGGLVIAQARNELFSFFSVNRYSHEFVLERLIDIPTLRKHAKESGIELESVESDLKTCYFTDFPPIRKGKEDEPGYDQVLSRSHNPITLERKFASAGFEQVHPLFFHYHCLPPVFESRFPEFFRQESLRAEDPQSWRGYFMASAFLLVGKRK